MIVTSIGNGAFDGCSGLGSITIPDSVTSIGDSAFRDCSSLTKVYYAGTAETWYNIEIWSENACLANATVSDKDGHAIPYHYEHAWSEPEWTWAADYSGATATFTCQEANYSHAKDVTAEVWEEVKSTPTFEADGEAVYHASVWFDGQEYSGDITVILPKPETVSLTLGEQAAATINVPGESARFSFTPEMGGVYLFYSNSDTDTRVSLYDGSMNLLAEDDDSGEGHNFNLGYEYAQGETYYYEVRFYSDGDTGSFPVQMDPGNPLTGGSGTGDGFHQFLPGHRHEIPFLEESDRNERHISNPAGVQSLPDPQHLEHTAVVRTPLPVQIRQFPETPGKEFLLSLPLQFKGTGKHEVLKVHKDPSVPHTGFSRLHSWGSGE